MRNALERVRLDKESTTKVSSSSGIPQRTLRRYVKFSKSPKSIFFIEEPEESEDENIIVWKPQTAVPMFKLWTECSADTSASVNHALGSDNVDAALTQDGNNAEVPTFGAFIGVDKLSAGANFDDLVDVGASGDGGLSSPQATYIDCTLGSDNVDIASIQDDSNAIVATAPHTANDVSSGANVGDLVDVFGDDGLSISTLCATDVFDNSDFDELFQDFASDGMFDDN